MNYLMFVFFLSGECVWCCGAEQAADGVRGSYQIMQVIMFVFLSGERVWCYCTEQAAGDVRGSYQMMQVIMFVFLSGERVWCYGTEQAAGSVRGSYQIMQVIMFVFLSGECVWCCGTEQAADGVRGSYQIMQVIMFVFLSGECVWCCGKEQAAGSVRGAGCAAGDVLGDLRTAAHPAQGSQTRWGSRSPGRCQIMQVIMEDIPKDMSVWDTIGFLPVQIFTVVCYESKRLKGVVTGVCLHHVWVNSMLYFT